MEEVNMIDEATAAADTATYETQPTVVIYENAPTAVATPDMKSKFWTHEATLLLIELYKSYQESMKDPRIKKKDVWNRIAADMAANGFNFHGDMCDKKWRNLKKSYHSVLENNRVPGQTRRLWQYFDVLHDVFSRESGDPVPSTSDAGVLDGVTNGSLVGNSSGSSQAKARLKNNASGGGAASAATGSNSLIDGSTDGRTSMRILKEILERQEQNEEKRMSVMMDELRKMHDENLDVMRERNLLLHRLIDQLSAGT